MSLPEEIAGDLEELEAEIPHTFTWNGTDYPCVRGSARRSKNNQSGGWSMEADLVLFVRTSFFENVASWPQLKQRLTHESRTWLIDEVIAPSGSPFLRLVCIDPAKGI